MPRPLLTALALLAMPTAVLADDTAIAASGRDGAPRRKRLQDSFR